MMFHFMSLPCIQCNYCHSIERFHDDPLPQANRSRAHAHGCIRFLPACLGISYLPIDWHVVERFNHGHVHVADQHATRVVEQVRLLGAFLACIPFGSRVPPSQLVHEK